MANVSNKALAGKAGKTMKSESKGNNTSPLYLFHKLTKDTKKSELNPETKGHKEVLNLCKKYFSVKEFSFACVCVDRYGRICKVKAYKGDYTFNEVINKFAGSYELIPIKISESSLIEAIKTKCAMYGTIEDELIRNATSAAKAAEELDKARTAIKAAFGVDVLRMLSDTQVLEKYNIIKAA